MPFLQEKILNVFLMVTSKQWLLKMVRSFFLNVCAKISISYIGSECMCAEAYLTYGSTCIYYSKSYTHPKSCLHNCMFKMLGNPDLMCLFFTVHRRNCGLRSPLQRWQCQCYILLWSLVYRYCQVKLAFIILNVQINWLLKLYNFRRGKFLLWKIIKKNTWFWKRNVFLLWCLFYFSSLVILINWCFCLSPLSFLHSWFPPSRFKKNKNSVYKKNAQYILVSLISKTSKSQKRGRPL